MNTIDKVKLAKEASIQLAACGTELKNRALEAVAAALRAESAAILAANKTDLAAAEAAGLTRSMKRSSKASSKASKAW